MCVEAQGFVGGIWILWDASVVDLEVVAMDAQVITIIIFHQCKVEWVLSVIYASPNPNT